MSKAAKKKNKAMNDEGVLFLDWRPPQISKGGNDHDSIENGPPKKNGVITAEERAKILQSMIGRYEEKAGKEVEDNVLLHPSSSRGKSGGSSSGGGSANMIKHRLKTLPFSKDVLVALYFFVNIGFLAFSSFDYYSLIGPYIDYGGDEALVTFAAFGTVLYYLCLRFFYLYIDRCRNMMHVILIFLIPSTFFELSYEVYLDQVQLVSGFDRWFVFYREGELALKQKNEDKAAYALFRRSVDGWTAEPRDPKFMLRFKSFAQMAMIEGKYSFGAKNEDKEKILKNDMALWKLYPEGEVPNEELLLLTLDMARLSRELGLEKDRYLMMQKIKAILKLSSTKSEDFIYGYLYELILMTWQPDNKATMLTPEVASEKFPESSLKQWDSYLNYALKKFSQLTTPGGGNLKFQKELLVRVFAPLNILRQNGFEVYVLDNYLKVLAVLRNSQLTEELGHVYSVVAEIYEKQGQAEKALIYRENADKLQPK